MADKRNILNGKMHSNCMLLPDHIVSHTQHTKQTDPLSKQHIKYKDITSHSQQLRSKRQSRNVQITTHMVLTN